MSKAEKKRHKVLKNVVKKDETIALQQACEKFNTTSRYLKANHTETCFVFELIR